MDFERNYWLLTIQRDKSTETIAYEGNLIYFILIERELGSDTNILWSKEITKDEYFYYHKQTEKK